MKQNAKRFWTMLGMFSLGGLALAACSSDDPIVPAGAGAGAPGAGAGGKATAGAGGKATAGAGGKATAGAGGKVAMGGSGGDAGAEELGGAAGESAAGAGGEAPVPECTTKAQCTGGALCDSNGTCVSCTTASVLFTYTPPGAVPTNVAVKGEFNGWTESAMTKGVDGKFTVSLPMAPGKYPYGFLVDNVWTLDPANGDIFAGNDHNSRISVDCAGRLAPECFNTAGCSADKACTNSECVPACDHTFTYSGAATKMEVSGHFNRSGLNNWTPPALTMVQGPTDMWNVTLRLPPGSYEYQLVKNDSYILDPTNSNPTQNNNSVLVHTCDGEGGAGGSN